ncbi:hypothetical protein K503DRAFT_796507 [Rhizopogon vinicolor AM-OR11-026]|uniref:Ricin B lectin domain-containing protein n=1 Tax=Rhizopogon vinicolor AM-OR11-026 TaxID=1314800 RepID=A0A1B7NEG9_9AGAM|nr:hypothetical protein K503DRAFT_796507 [Rhizopogon vinicolor AM-OR11-026]
MTFGNNSMGKLPSTAINNLDVLSVNKRPVLLIDYEVTNKKIVFMALGALPGSIKRVPGFSAERYFVTSCTPSPLFLKFELGVIEFDPDLVSDSEETGPTLVNIKLESNLDESPLVPGEVPGAIVCSVGNRLGSDIWNVATTESTGLTIQSFGTGAFVSYANNTGVVTSNSIHSWTLEQNNAVPYAWNIVDTSTGLALTVEGNSTANGARVVAATGTSDASQAWFFIAKVPVPDTN